MDFIQQNQFFILLALVISAFTVLFIKIARINRKIKKIFGHSPSDGSNLKNELLRRVSLVETKLEELEPYLAEMGSISEKSIHKVGFIRFNPFQDTGGNNSFILVMLDTRNNGVILSSLYMRDGIRIYGKKIEQGRAKQPLSNEEEKILKETIQK